MIDLGNLKYKEIIRNFWLQQKFWDDKDGLNGVSQDKDPNHKFL